MTLLNSYSIQACNPLSVVTLKQGTPNGASPSCVEACVATFFSFCPFLKSTLDNKTTDKKKTSVFI